MKALLDVLHGGLVAIGHCARQALHVVYVDEHDQMLGLGVEPEEGQATGDLLLVEIAGDELVEEVSGQPLLGLGHRFLLHQLERRDGHHVVQDDAVVVGEVATVFDDGQEGADAVRGDHGEHLHARARPLQPDGEVLPRGTAIGDLAPQVGDQLAVHFAPVSGLAEHEAVKVEEYGRAADQGGERRQDRLEPFLLENDGRELLVHGQAALQKRVLLVDYL